VYRDIFGLLDNLAKKGRILCPVSFPLFLELMKQNDEGTRFATAWLMDCFSGGVCLQYPRELQRLELRQRILQVVLGERAPDLKEWVWTKAGYLFGELLPVNKTFSQPDIDFFQKVSIDGMWTLPLEYFAEMDPSEISTLPEQQLADATNSDAAWYREARLSFEEVLIREKAYLVRLLKGDMAQIAREIWEEYPNHRDVSRMPEIREDEFDHWALPSVQVLAGVNAGLITSQKKFSANDLLDFQHAALAVPYCDALFCDGGLAQVLRTKPLEFGKIYETVILSRPNEIVEYLGGLVR